MYHRDESVLSALEEISNGEWDWQHPAYLHEKSWPGMPLPGTIAWHVAHLVHSARHYSAIIRERPVKNEPDTPPPEINDTKRLLNELHKAHEELLQTVSEISDSSLSGECARGMTLDEFLRMVIRHNTWHAGQIRMLRRLLKYKLK